MMEKTRDVRPVQSEATASHVDGRRCTGIEQTNSLSSLSDGCKDSTKLEAMEERISTNTERKIEKKRDVRPVESKATASHVNGRRCTRIEQTNSLSSLGNGCKDKTTKRGFQHLYMSKTTTSTSLRVHAADKGIKGDRINTTSSCRLLITIPSVLASTIYILVVMVTYIMT
jgi:hypothetical protein